MKLHELFEKAIRNHKTTVHINTEDDQSDAVHQAIRKVMRDNPDIFWFVHQYSFDERTGTISLSYQFSNEKCLLLQESIDDVVNNDFYLNYVKTLRSYEQVAYVYKWLLTYCNYNVNSGYNQTIDSVFVRRNSVCTGYAKAAQYLFKLLGIDSRLVFGRLNNDAEGGRHCWNIVVIDGQPYHLDVCLGAVTLEDVLRQAGVQKLLHYGNFNYNCFCVSTSEIAKTRSIEEKDSLPYCDKSLDTIVIKKLSQVVVKERKENLGCLLSQAGSTADIFLCSRDKNVILKRFRGGDSDKCAKEYQFMKTLEKCDHVLHLCNSYSDINNNIIAVEQSTPIIDLFCSHYYRPSFHSVLMMIRDVAVGWLECYELHGILYRDIHVCNIYKANDGVYKLGDFGSCAYEREMVPEKVGALWFMSPETRDYGHFDERSAVYSITAVLCFVLNEFRPLVLGNNVPSLLRTFPKKMAEEIVLILKKGLAKHPLERTASIKELLVEINGLFDKTWSQDILLQFRSSFFSSDGMGRMVTTIDPFQTNNDQDDRQLVPESPPYSHHVESYCCTMKANMSIRPTMEEKCVTYSPYSRPHLVKNKPSIGKSNSEVTEEALSGIGGVFRRLFKHKKTVDCPQTLDFDEVYSSVFAPGEVKKRSSMLVQVYLHLYEETEKVKELATEAQKDAERRDYIPLQCKLQTGDKVDVQLNIVSDTLLKSEKKSLVWHGMFTKCSFVFSVSKDIDVDELGCTVLLSVGGGIVGEMRFVTQIVDQPRQLNPEVFARQYRKIFISYAHQDESKVAPMARAYRAQGVNYFFDRHYLKPGDFFPMKIRDYIDTADLFILCWSANAARSDYVEMERKYALERSFPQVKPIEKAKLSIYPMSIEPRAELPEDMKDIYNFEVI